MKLPKFLKIKKPEPKQTTEKKVRGKPLIRVWKKFLQQIPREFRVVTKTHQHFLVLGDAGSGKTELIKGIVEQSQNIYPFEVEYENEEDLQIYLGPKQIIQEISLKVVKDRSIKVRRLLIHLWKKLFIKAPPIVVIAYNILDQSNNAQDLNKSARLMSGKLSLLNEICKSKTKVRVALTHLDKLDGYVEFARFLKQHNIAFQIPLRSDFENETIANHLNAFREEHLSLILTSSSAADYLKILNFFEELSKLFPKMEEFLRILTAASASVHIELESLTFTSNLEPFTSFTSFDWTQSAANSIFNRHPMLKHQVAAAAILVMGFGLIFNNFFKDYQEVKLARQGIDSLAFLQSQYFVDECIPKIEKINEHRPKNGYLPILPRFFKKDISFTNQDLAGRIRKHIFEPKLREFMLNDGAEVKTFYMLGLIHATNKNPLGDYIIRNLSDWSQKLNLEERLIKAYISSSGMLNNKPIMIDHLDQINVSTPISDSHHWVNFFNYFKDLIEQPVFNALTFNELRQEADRLHFYFQILEDDPHVFSICEQLSETKSRMLQDFQKNVKVLQWIYNSKPEINRFLRFIQNTCPDIPDVSHLNISQFFTKLKDVADLSTKPEPDFPFEINGTKYTFISKRWLQHASTHVIGMLINQYATANKNSNGNIFFFHTPEIEPQVFKAIRNEFPYFAKPVTISGRYTRLAFQKNVRNTTESIYNLLKELPINDEDRDRFKKFVNEEVISYANAYQENYEQAYKASSIKANSIEELKDTLGKILLPSAPLNQFLSDMRHQTEAFSDRTSCLDVLNEINHFDFLIPLLTQEEKGGAPIDRYKEIIRTVIADLNTDLRSSKGETLESYLTPAARITLSIIRNDPDSYTNQITDSLNAIGVHPEYHAVFKAPIMQICKLGIEDLRKGINSLWKESLFPQFELLAEKRPFNPQGQQLATYDEVAALTNPTSCYWNMIKDIISPVSQYVSGVWMPRPGAELQLSAEMYHSINQIAKASRLLWDSQGNPQPLHLQVKSLPFESKSHVYPAPIKSYLVTGEETFHNFNQSPQWHPIKVDWWKEANSAVFMELTTKNDSLLYRDSKADRTLWSFFELLGKAAQQENNVFSWDLNKDEGEDITKVALCFDQNPWSFFQVDTLGGQ